MNQSVKRHNDEGLGWTEADGIYTRNYDSYDAYKVKQGSKLDGRLGWCLARSNELRIALRERLQELAIEYGSVLCLGARLGGEVQAFIDVGCFAVGLDLNPGENSQYVVHGDFHDLQYADHSIDIVYTNSIDHCLNHSLLLQEIQRVLEPEGFLILEVKAGSDETEARSMGSDHWDCFEYDNVKLLSETVEKYGFLKEQQYKITNSKATPFGFVFRRLA